MGKWLLRGLVFAALMVFIRLVQGAAINAWETKALLISVTLVVIFAVIAVIWGFLDGRSDAKANPDPDRRADLAMTWLLAGLFAGIVSGAVAWLISLFYKDLFVGGLINELTTFAAFTALLTFVAAIAGSAVGHWVIDRHADDTPRKHHGYAAEGDDDERADTDVFAAVRHPDAHGERGERGERGEHGGRGEYGEEAPTERRSQEQT
jgi:MFS family permease